MSESLNDSAPVWIAPPANSATVRPLTLSVTEPLDPPPLKPVPAVTPVSPTLLVQPGSLLNCPKLVR